MTSTPDQVITNIREALEAGPYEGPWTVEEFQHDGRPCALIVSDGGTIIAEIRGYIDSCGNGENARFIAACNPQNIGVLLAALDAKDAETRCIVADVAKDFRAVNVDLVLSQMGDVVPMLLHRAEAAEAERDALRKALSEVRASIKNARGAVESNQVADKDVHGTLSRAILMIDAAIRSAADTPAPQVRLVGPDFQRLLRNLIENDGGEGSKCYDARLNLEARKAALSALAATATEVSDNG